MARASSTAAAADGGLVAPRYDVIVTVEPSNLSGLTGELRIPVPTGIVAALLADQGVDPAIPLQPLDWRDHVNGLLVEVEPTGAWTTQLSTTQSVWDPDLGIWKPTGGVLLDLYRDDLPYPGGPVGSDDDLGIRIRISVATPA